MKLIIILLSVILLCIESSNAQDFCQAVGWSTCDSLSNVSNAPTGGGDVAPVVVKDWNTLYNLAQKKTYPRVIYVQGTIGNGYGADTGKVVISSNTTLIGYPGAVIRGSLQIKRVTNVIIRNIKIEGPGSNTSQGLDNMCIDGSTKVWIDHCQFTNGGDGNCDIVNGSNNVSLTWCLFTYTTDGIHNLSNLIGGSDTENVSKNKLNITFQYCWWKDCADRLPRTRFGKIHVANCYSSMKPGMSSSNGSAGGHDANLRIENCVYENINNPIKAMSGVDSCIVVPINNQYINCTGSQPVEAISAGGYVGFIPPYKLTLTPTENVKALVTCGAGATMTSPTNCNSDCFTAIPEINDEQTDFYIFPTKTSNLVCVKFNTTNQKIYSLNVFDIFGRKVDSKEVTSLNNGENSVNLDFSYLTAGIYMIKINSNGIIKTQRIIKYQ